MLPYVSVQNHQNQWHAARQMSRSPSKRSLRKAIPFILPTLSLIRSSDIANLSRVPHRHQPLSLFIPSPFHHFTISPCDFPPNGSTPISPITTQNTHHAPTTAPAARRPHRAPTPKDPHPNRRPAVDMVPRRDGADPLHRAGGRQELLRRPGAELA